MVMALALTYINCHKKYSYARFSPFSNYFDFELFIFMHSMKNVCCIVVWADCCFWIRTADQNRKGPKLNGQNFNELLHILNLLSISTIVKMPKIGIQYSPRTILTSDSVFAVDWLCKHYLVMVNNTGATLLRFSNRILVFPYYGNTVHWTVIQYRGGGHMFTITV